MTTNFFWLFLVPRLLKNYVAFEIIISKADHCFIKRITSVSPEKFICRLFVCIFDKNKHCVDRAAVDKMIKQSLISFVLWAFWSDPHILYDCVPLKAPYSWYVCYKIQPQVSVVFTQNHIIQLNKNNMPFPGVLKSGGRVRFYCILALLDRLIHAIIQKYVVTMVVQIEERIIN